MSKKILTFSLWGNKPIYNVGAIKNSELALVLYPDFECWFYIHKDSVPEATIDALSKFDNVKIIFKVGDLTKCKPMQWRFEAIDDPTVEVMMSRDTDTRILQREVSVVREWLKSDKLFHIMRDHPHHSFKILGGMFGTRKIPTINSWYNLMNNYYGPHDTEARSYDQDFLGDIIYPIIVKDSMIHASYHKYEKHCIDFPDIRIDYHHIGEYVYADESRSQRHMNAIKRLQ